MCGIVGLFSKSLSVSERLGEHLGDMLLELSDRGPDSAGVALYRNPAPAGSTKVSLHSAAAEYDWDALYAELDEAFGSTEPDVRASHAVFVVDVEAAPLQAWLRERRAQLRGVSAGRSPGGYKGGGPPRGFVPRLAPARVPA